MAAPEKLVVYWRKWRSKVIYIQQTVIKHLLNARHEKKVSEMNELDL